MAKSIDRLPLCATCRHFRKNVHEYEACEAFPKGIPPSVLTWEVDHHLPVAGDHGIRYEKSSG